MRPGFPKRGGAVFLFAVFASIGIFSQDQGAKTPSIGASPQQTSDSTQLDASGVDNLFSNPQSDQVTTDSGADHSTTFEVAKSVKVEGDVMAKGGLGFGWLQWPDPNQLSAGLGRGVGIASTASLSFDARPDSNFHASGKLVTSFDPAGITDVHTQGQYAWITPYFSELKIDYNLQDSAWFTIGQFTTTWGQGRLFVPGNLMSDSANGVSFKMTLPTVLAGFSAIAMAQNGFFQNATAPQFSEVAWGASLDEVLGPLRIGLAGRWRAREGLRGLLSLKTTIWGTDLLFDGVVASASPSTITQNLSANLLNPVSVPVSSASAVTMQSLTGFFREWGDFKLYGEWWWNGATVANSGKADNTLGLVVALTHQFGIDATLGIQWLHAMIDDSGIVTTGLNFSPFPHVTLAFGAPVVYGAEDSRYVLANTTPGKLRVSLGVMITIDGNF